MERDFGARLENLHSEPVSTHDLFHYFSIFFILFLHSLPKLEQLSHTCSNFATGMIPRMKKNSNRHARLSRDFVTYLFFKIKIFIIIYFLMSQ